jgi:hypothetical protein
MKHTVSANKPKKPVLVPNPDCPHCGGTGKRLVVQTHHGNPYDYSAACSCLKRVDELPLFTGDAKTRASGEVA